jgi:hypothetical protein
MANPPTWSNVKFLCHCNGSDGTTSFTDVSASAHTITANGGAQVDSIAKFGTGSAQFDGDGDSLTTAQSTDFDFGSGDFTVEFQVRFSEDVYGEIVGCWGTNGWSVWTDQVNSPNVIGFDYNDNDDPANYVFIERDWSASWDTFYHVAVCRSGSNLRFFIDGTQVGTTATITDTLGDTDAGLAIGTGPTGDLTGRVDEIRIAKEAVYTADFTAPTSEFLDGSGVVEGVAAAAGSSTVSGSSVDVVSGDGTAAGAATVSGVGYSAVVLSTPFAVENTILVSVGCAFHVNIESAVSAITVPFHVGPYIKTISVPFHVNIPTAVATISCPFHVYGDLTTVATADFVQWRPKVVLDGTDISAKLIGALEIESEEMAAPIASFSFIPASGSVDPLAWVGKTVTISWQRYVGGVLTNTALRFTGVVSDPSWDADERILSISATSDLQGRLDRMTKAQIDTLLTSVSPSYSEYVFGPAEDLSGWEYAQALISTTDAVLWQDQAAVIKATSTATRAVADYTFGTDDIIAGSLGDSPQYPSRTELVNKLTVVFEYRFARRRQRHITCVFRSVDLDTPSTYLSGNLGGWELPQRTQVASAAESGGWAVIGDISYTDVWPGGLYSTYSDSGVPMMEGWVNNPVVTDELCIGAQWTAARRWLQTVTETATLTVQSTESQAVVGILADNESYSINDEATDEEWESSLEYDDYATGAVLMSNTVDKRLDLDELRDEFEDAQEVAIAKARNDILRAHRGTTVTFSAPFLPALNLSHTVAIDTTYLDCQGKVRRITDTWNLDTGECLSTVDVALFRHNGAGLVTDTPVAAVEKAADRDGARNAVELALVHRRPGRSAEVVNRRDGERLLREPAV